MEHRLILGGEQFLPFARSCITKLKKLGLPYASQSFEVDGVSIKVRIEPGHEYIRLEGGGGLIWVLLTLDTATPPNGVAVNALNQGDTPLVTTHTRQTKLIRLDRFEAKHSKVMHSAQASHTSTLSIGRTFSNYGDPSIYPPKNTQFEASRVVTGTDTYLECPTDFAVYGGRVATLSTADNDSIGGERTHVDTSWVRTTYIRDLDGNIVGVLHTIKEGTDATYHRSLKTRIKLKETAADYAFSYQSTYSYLQAGVEPSPPPVTTSSTSGDSAFPPVFFTPSPEYSLGSLRSFMYERAGPEFIEVIPATSFVGPFNTGSEWTWADGPLVVNTTPDDPEWDAAMGPTPRERRRREVSWHKQGADFIQYGGDYAPTYDRYSTPASLKYFEGGARSFACSYTMFVTVGGEGLQNYAWKLVLRRQFDGPAYTVKTLDLREVPEVKSSPEFLYALNVSTTPLTVGAVGKKPEFNRIAMSAYVVGTVRHVLTVQLMFDQKALFVPNTQWY